MHAKKLSERKFTFLREEKNKISTQKKSIRRKFLENERRKKNILKLKRKKAFSKLKIPDFLASGRRLGIHILHSIVLDINRPFARRGNHDYPTREDPKRSLVGDTPQER